MYRMVLNTPGLEGRMKWVLGVALLALSGCTTSTDEMSYSQLQAYAASMVEKCQKQGVPEAVVMAHMARNGTSCKYALRSN